MSPAQAFGAIAYILFQGLAADGRLRMSSEHDEYALLCGTS